MVKRSRLRKKSGEKTKRLKRTKYTTAQQGSYKSFGEAINRIPKVWNEKVKKWLIPDWIKTVAIFEKSKLGWGGENRYVLEYSSRPDETLSESKGIKAERSFIIHPVWNAKHKIYEGQVLEVIAMDMEGNRILKDLESIGWYKRYKKLK